MRPLIQEIQTAHTPESLGENLRGENGVVLLRTSQFDLPSVRPSHFSPSAPSVRAAKSLPPALNSQPSTLNFNSATPGTSSTPSWRATNCWTKLTCRFRLAVRLAIGATT